MSEAAPFVELDAVALSALLASRLCHDLINPVGAIGSGLEVLDDSAMDPAMRDAALDLIRTGGGKSIALLKFARLAYGAAGGFGAEIPLEEAEAALREIFKWTKAELVWRLRLGLAPKEQVKAILILGYAAADCVPRGGTVTISGAPQSFVIEARGARTILNAELVTALGGDATDLKPKFAPAYLAGLLARQTGGAISAELQNETILFSAEFAAVEPRAALTVG
jgi:histidine phosphotransferase ChpT